jgi:hypothetical protein
MGRLTRLLAILCTAVALLPACSVTRSEPVMLRVLASSELVDLAPVLADLRADTGVELQMDLRGLPATTGTTSLGWPPTVTSSSSSRNPATPDRNRSAPPSCCHRSSSG